MRSCWVENGALMGLPPSAVARSPAQMKLLLSCLYGLTLFPCLQQVIRGVQPPLQVAVVGAFSPLCHLYSSRKHSYTRGMFLSM